MKLSERNSNYIKKIVFVFVMVLVVVSGLEGATRLFLPDKRIQLWVPPEVGEFNAMLGWSLKPLSQSSSNAGGYEIEYSINSKGLRDDETTYEKPEGIFRIILIGDSNTFGYGVPIEKHFSTLLEGYFKNVEVINMGVSGFGVDQELLYLRSEGFRYEPDLVLAYVPHYGDYRHMHTERFGKGKPRFVRVDGELVLKNSPVVQNPSRPNLRKLHHRFLRHSNAYAIFYKGIIGLGGFERKGIIVGLKEIVGLTTQESHSVSKKRLDKENLKDAAFRNELYDLGKALIYTMHEESLEHGATFLLVTRMKELHEASLGKHLLSLNVRKSLSNPKLTLPNAGGHSNEPANGILAWEVAKFLQTNQLIPIAHLNNKKP